MKKLRLIKILALAGMVALALLLTGCVVPPDDIDNGGYTVNKGDFQDVAPPTRVPVTQAPTTAPPTNPPANNNDFVDVWGQQSGQQSEPTIDTNSLIGTGTGVTTNPGSLFSQITPSIIKNTDKPTASAATSSTLKHGSKGSDVKKLQQRLKELGYLKGSADGDFGDATENAVINFQKQNGLTADGKAGTRTLEKLYSSDAKKAPTTVTTPRRTATPTPRATATPNLSSDYYLEVGSSGSKVRTLQNRLIELGWMDGKANGEYGEATEYAVKAFQRRYSSLYDDGVAGPSTLKILYGNGAAKSTSPVSSIGETLEYGDKGDGVKALQTRLKSLGFLKGSADGTFGDATKAAVIAFQTANSIKADGRAGTSTLNKLYSSDAKDADSLKNDSAEDEAEGGKNESSTTEKPGVEEDIVINGYIVLKEGSKGDEVKKLQRALKNRGYFSNSITGYYGENTAAAVMAFQQQNGLKADGVAGPATQNLLYNTESTSDYTTLKNGSRGTEVKNLQYALKELGYFDANVTGTYADLTEDAVRAFQIQNKISPVTGVADENTQRKLYSSSAIAASAPTTSYTELDKGDKGDLVVQLQEALADLGYLSEPTGRYDDATVEAVKNFQRRNGLTVNGKAGQSTLSLLYTGNPRTAY